MPDGSQPSLTFWRALATPEFWLLVVASVSAAAGLAWWVAIPLTVAGLSVAALPKYIALWPRARDAGASREWWLTVGLSMLNTLAAACAAFLLGNLIRWLWW